MKCQQKLWWMLKTDEHFRPPVGAVFPRTESAQLETAPTKRENGSFVFLTGPVWRVPLILRSTINTPIFAKVLDSVRFC